MDSQCLVASQKAKRETEDFLNRHIDDSNKGWPKFSRDATDSVSKWKSLMLEDKLLVWKFKRGSKEALCHIYEKYRDDLLRIAAGLLNETSVAEDIVHDVFVVFVRSAKQFQLTGSLRGYLARCVVNRARNVNLSRQRRQTVSMDNTEPIALDSKRPDQWIICSEEFTRLSNAMTVLPYEQREAVILHIQGGMKFREIAKLQCVSDKTAQSRFRYGLTKLRSILNSEVTK
ncbi:MAG: RNA polymerase sigma factor [Planctomycetota bacterium]|jgi:RNA polymerase sigma-70 factor (ECF subfamily)